MKYILKYGTYYPLACIAFLWAFKWVTYEKMKKELNNKITAYALGAFHFGLFGIVVGLLINQH